MKIVLIAILLCACQAAAPTPAGPPVPAPTPATQRTIMAAGQGEYSSRWIIWRAGATQVTRTDRAVGKRIDGCKTSGAIKYARTAAPDDVPDAWLETDGPIPAGLPYLQLLMGQGDCYAATRYPAPVSCGVEWWAKPGQAPVDMCRGGGTPQCPGECPWYTRLA